MTDAKWTPGEWYAPKPEDNPSAIKSDQGHRAVYVADVLDPRDRSLIAAAPDLYDALLIARGVMMSAQQAVKVAGISFAVELANAALAKARGDG